MGAVTTPTPQEYADAVSTWEGDSWWRLEAHAFRAHPAVLLALAHLAPTQTWDEFARVKTSWLNPVLAISQIASVLLPPLAAFGMSRVLFWGSGTVDLLLFGALIGAGAALGILGLVLTVGRPEGRHPRTARKIGLLHVVSALAAFALGAIALTQGRLEGIVGFLGPVVDLSLGVYLVVRFRTLPADENLDNVKRAGVRLKRHLDRLTPAENVAIVDELHGAIDRLRQRGLIDDEAAQEAKAAPVGLLAVMMSQRPQATDIS